MHRYKLQILVPDNVPAPNGWSHKVSPRGNSLWETEIEAHNMAEAMGIVSPIVMFRDEVQQVLATMTA